MSHTRLRSPSLPHLLLRSHICVHTPAETHTPSHTPTLAHSTAACVCRLPDQTNVSSAAPQPSRSTRARKTTPYVPIGQYLPNKEGRICKCGSGTHLTATHNMCPLNKGHWPSLPQSKDRLKLYVGHKVWRWWDFHDGPRTQCHGEVSAVSEDLQLRIKYHAGDDELVTEKVLLDTVKTMKKDISGEKKRKSRQYPSRSKTRRKSRR